MTNDTDLSLDFGACAMPFRAPGALSSIDLSDAVANGLITFSGYVAAFAMLAWLACTIIEVVSRAFRWDFDETDDRAAGSLFGVRSHLYLRTDHATGMQYVVTPKGHITPRLDAEGRPMRKAAP